MPFLNRHLPHLSPERVDRQRRRFGRLFSSTAVHVLNFGPLARTSR